MYLKKKTYHAFRIENKNQIQPEDNPLDRDYKYHLSIHLHDLNVNMFYLINLCKPHKLNTVPAMKLMA